MKQNKLATTLLLIFLVSPLLIVSISFVKADNTNYAPIPSAWMTSNTNMDWGIGSSNAVGMDTYPVTVAGQTAIQMQRNSYYISTGVGGPAIAEADSYYRYINIGDHITYSAWFYTDSSTAGNTDPLSGAVLGLDFYGVQGRICEISTPDGTPTYPTYPTSHSQDVG
jgi:hypothetical protein